MCRDSSDGRAGLQGMAERPRAGRQHGWRSAWVRLTNRPADARCRTRSSPVPSHAPVGGRAASDPGVHPPNAGLADADRVCARSWQALARASARGWGRWWVHPSARSRRLMWSGWYVTPKRRATMSAMRAVVHTPVGYPDRRGPFRRSAIICRCSAAVSLGGRPGDERTPTDSGVQPPAEGSAAVGRCGVRASQGPARPSARGGGLWWIHPSACSRRLMWSGWYVTPKRRATTSAMRTVVQIPVAYPDRHGPARRSSIICCCSAAVSLGGRPGDDRTRNPWSPFRVHAPRQRTTELAAQDIRSATSWSDRPSSRSRSARRRRASSHSAVPLGRTERVLLLSRGSIARRVVALFLHDAIDSGVIGGMDGSGACTDAPATRPPLRAPRRRTRVDGRPSPADPGGLVGTAAPLLPRRPRPGKERP